MKLKYFIQCIRPLDYLISAFIIEYDGDFGFKEW